MSESLFFIVCLFFFNEKFNTWTILSKNTISNLSFFSFPSHSLTIYCYLFQVFPTSGPVKGNTIITISGTDLGKEFTDIETIQVGTKDCHTSGLEEYYKPGIRYMKIFLPNITTVLTLTKSSLKYGINYAVKAKFLLTMQTFFSSSSCIKKKVMKKHFSVWVWIQLR